MRPGAATAWPHGVPPLALQPHNPPILRPLCALLGVMQRLSPAQQRWVQRGDEDGGWRAVARTVAGREQAQGDRWIDRVTMLAGTLWGCCKQPAAGWTAGCGKPARPFTPRTLPAGCAARLDWAIILPTPDTSKQAVYGLKAVSGTSEPPQAGSSASYGQRSIATQANLCWSSSKPSGSITTMACRAAPAL